eukprot:2448575-Karenia_brevis.AAC.1
MQCMTVFCVQKEGALATTVKNTRSHFSARCAGKYFLRPNIIRQCGDIVFNKSLAALIVFLHKWNQHFSVECAGKYFRVQ